MNPGDRDVANAQVRCSAGHTAKALVRSGRRTRSQASIAGLAGTEVGLLDPAGSGSINASSRSLRVLLFRRSRKRENANTCLLTADVG